MGKRNFHGNRHVNDAKKTCVDCIEQPVFLVSLLLISLPAARKIA